MIDFAVINSAAMVNFRALVQEWFPHGQPRGREWVVGDLDGNPGDSLSINTEDGIWKDFATGEGGSDPIGLYAAMRRIKPGEAALELAQRFGVNTDNNQPERKTTDSSKRPARRKRIVWRPVVPVPSDAPPPPETFVRMEGAARHEYPIEDRWEYKTADGGIIGLVVRYRTRTGKETPPLTYCRKSDGEQQWRFLGFPKPLPLYNLPRLTQTQEPVLGVEGEKCARALQRFFDESGTKITVTTWPGGCKSVANVDWTPLKGKNFCYWPDADLKKYPKRHPKAGQVMLKHEQPGYAAALKIADQVKSIVSKIQLIDPPDMKPDGWDCYDAIHTDNMGVQEILELIRQRKIDPPRIDADPKRDPLADAPFRCLGYHEDYHYYLPEGTGQVKAIKGESHNASALMTLAPLEWWWSRFAGKNGPDWQRAANAVLRANEKMKVYDPSKRRGRGAWWDNGRIVVHFGESLSVDGKPHGLSDIQTRFVYETGLRIDDNLAKPLSDTEAEKMVQIMQSFWWDRPMHSVYASGWCVLATICGAINWRPHLWLTGPSGTGKSWVMKNVIKPALGPWALFVAGDTSAPGIRQTLRSDALPVLFDEAEGEDDRSRQRMHGVFELMRQSSYESGAKIRKGTQSQKALEFDIRSMFCLSSIGVNATQRADLSRLIVVSLRKPRHLNRKQRDNHFTSICNLVQKTLTPEWCAALRSRSISLIPAIRENSMRFSQAIAELLGDRRLGDQAGALAAGAYSLTSSGVISLEDARKWAHDMEWDDLQDAEQTDERMCLETILQYVMRDGGHEISIEECLVELAERQPALVGIDPLTEEQQRYTSALKRVGIRLDPDEQDKNQFRLWISDSHTGLKKILEKTPWPQTWARLLKRLPEAETKPVLRFFTTSTRATGIPWRVVVGEEEKKD